MVERRPVSLGLDRFQPKPAAGEPGEEGDKKAVEAGKTLGFIARAEEVTAGVDAPATEQVNWRQKFREQRVKRDAQINLKVTKEFRSQFYEEAIKFQSSNRFLEHLMELHEKFKREGG
jgi:hypothetical protein